MDSLEPFRVGDWQLAEENAARWMRHWGFADAAVTNGGADGGLDVTSQGAVAQVKFKVSQTGGPDVQRLAGAANRFPDAQPMFFTGTGYSSQAIQCAEESGIALFIYDLSGSVVSANHLAEQFLEELEQRQLRQSAYAREVEQKSGKRLANAFVRAESADEPWKNYLWGALASGLGSLFFLSAPFRQASKSPDVHIPTSAGEWVATVFVEVLLTIWLAHVCLSVSRKAKILKAFSRRSTDIPTETRIYGWLGIWAIVFFLVPFALIPSSHSAKEVLGNFAVGFVLAACLSGAWVYLHRTNPSDRGTSRQISQG